MSVQHIIAGSLVTACLFSLVACAPKEEASTQNAAQNQEVIQQALVEERANQLRVDVSVSSDVSTYKVGKEKKTFQDETLAVNGQSGTTALTYLAGLGRDVQTEDTDNGVQVVAIDGLENGDGGKGTKWVFEVNGQRVDDSPATYVVKPDEAIAFRFVKK